MASCWPPACSPSCATGRPTATSSPSAWRRRACPRSMSARSTARSGSSRRPASSRPCGTPLSRARPSARTRSRRPVTPSSQRGSTSSSATRASSARWPAARRRKTPSPPLLRQFFDDAYLTADRMFDRGQGQAFRWLWFFLPETSVAKDLRFQQIAASRFFSDAGQQALAYGALIIVARNGGSALDLALIGMAALLPPALLGLYGGEVADALPRRVALAGIYNLQALACFLVPFVAGTDIWSLFALIFAVNALGQVSGPTESAVLPLVATEQQLASATSLVHFASSAGTAFGTALLAPILVLVFDERAVMYVAGGLLIVAATRVFDLATGEPPRQTRLARPSARLLPALRMLAQQPAVSTMIFVAVLSGTANIVLQTLAPRYVVAALHVDAANAVYVFAPSAAGLVAALALGPTLMKLWGERLSALCGFLITTVDLLLLGLIGNIS